MKRSRRLRPVAEVAQGREQREAVQLAAARQRLDVAEAQRQQLDRYRQEYRTGTSGASGQDLRAGMLKNQRAFMGQLDTAIAAADERVATARSDHDRQHQQWSRARARSKAVGKLMARHRTVESARDERREQHRLDEAAARQPKKD